MQKINYFLAKTEPETFSIDDFERDGITIWDGVKSAQAISFIKEARVGDLVLIYHSVKERAIVGLGRVISEPRKDLNVTLSERSRINSWVFDLEFIRKFEKPVNLSEIKATGLFNDFRLVYQSRLSVMSVPEKFIEWLENSCGLNLVD